MSIVSGEFLFGSPFGPVRPALVTTSISALEPFTPGEHFRIDPSPDAVVRIVDIMSAFDELVWKREEAQPTIRVQGRPYCGLVTVGAMMQDSGPENNLTLGQLWALLKQQPRGQDGLLCTDGRLNLFLVSLNGQQRFEVTAQLDMEQAGWVLGATPLEPECIYDRGTWAFRRVP